jgi:hypothetical protein
MSLLNVPNQKTVACAEDGSSSLLTERKIPLRGTIQAVFKAAEKLPDLSDADFDDLENCVVTRGISGS